MTDHTPEPELIDRKLERKYATLERRLYAKENDGSDDGRIYDQMDEVKEKQDELRRSWLEWAKREYNALDTDADEQVHLSVADWNAGDVKAFDQCVGRWLYAQGQKMALVERMHAAEGQLELPPTPAECLLPWRQQLDYMYLNDLKEITRQFMWWYKHVQGGAPKLSYGHLMKQPYRLAREGTSYTDNNRPEPPGPDLMQVDGKWERM